MTTMMVTFSSHNNMQLAREDVLDEVPAARIHLALNLMQLAVEVLSSEDAERVREVVERYSPLDITVQNP